ncbi:hypothetical protein ElyMa_005674200 [Elysia marginata]|uniref:Uncharacterized protein n=1 Tax=Elysia marginata TaxID=1093978 RepID=A0AAV4FCW9_9GAST|nr:hypothetical protein ElyMa_005674200 [Elysia marginata]
MADGLTRRLKQSSAAVRSTLPMCFITSYVTVLDAQGLSYDGQITCVFNRQIVGSECLGFSRPNHKELASKKSLFDFSSLRLNHAIDCMDKLYHFLWFPCNSSCFK